MHFYKSKSYYHYLNCFGYLEDILLVYCLFLIYEGGEVPIVSIKFNVCLHCACFLNATSR